MLKSLSRRLQARRGRGSSRPGERRLFIESLEGRLALAWGGTPPATITPPTGSASVGVTLNQNDATGSATIAASEVDYYAFTATATGAYTISALTPNSNLDTVLGVFSSSGQRLAYNDDISFFSNTDSRLTVNLVAGARYYVGITNYSTRTLGAYTWTMDGPAGTTPPAPNDDAYENNDTFATAYDLGQTTSARTLNNLILADTDDWYKFTTTGAGTSASSVSIAFQNPQGNLQLQLYNSSNTLLATSQGTGNSESLSLNGRAAGTYYVHVYGATNPSYSLTVTPPVSTTPPPAGGFQITLSMSGLTASQQAIFQQAAARWAQVIVGDLPNANYRGTSVDDMLISASASAIDGVNGVLGQAGPDAFRSGSSLPYHGTMQFDSADMASMEQSGLLYSVVLHEMGHVLGIGTIWSTLGMLSGTNTSNPIFVGAQATAAYNQLAGTSAAGVPVENTGGPGTALGHWRETTFGSELMTGWAGPGTNLPMSRVTVASLADIGYTVNLAAADSYTLGSRSAVTSTASSRSSSTGSIIASLSSPDVATGSAFVELPGRDATDRTAREAPWRAIGSANGFTFSPRVFGGDAAEMASARQVAFDASDSQDAACSDPDVADAAWDSLDSDWDLSGMLAAV